MHADDQRWQYNIRRRAGLCVRCGKPAIPTFTRCVDHARLARLATAQSLARKRKREREAGS